MEKPQHQTEAEAYLAALCRHSFLSIWSYPNVYRAPAKELADLLVVCGRDVIVFQDKQAKFPNSGDINKDWARWFRRTVRDGAKQVWGAERFLRAPETKLYQDAAAQTPVPIELPSPDQARFHLVVVTHGGSARCQEEFNGGSGSFLLHTDVAGIKQHTKPFVIGDLDSGRSYVHVWDDATLEILMRSLDTITDFVNYLHKKELLVRSKRWIWSTGEEELLANYLANVDSHGAHDFDFPDVAPGTHIIVTEGNWAEFCMSPQRVAQQKQNRISYFWDRLIEHFNEHALAGTSYVHPEDEGGISLGEHEELMRYLALEPRYVRRTFSESIFEAVEKTPANMRFLRLMPSPTNKGVWFLLLLLPVPEGNEHTHDDYRGVRRDFLQASCLAAKRMRPEIEHIVGIATESGKPPNGRSEDAVYIDMTEWTEELEQEAARIQEEEGIFTSPIPRQVTFKEYPEVVSPEEFRKNPRNKPCPCGSGKKYKKCCL